MQNGFSREHQQHHTVVEHCTYPIVPCLPPPPPTPLVDCCGVLHVSYRPPSLPMLCIVPPPCPPPHPHPTPPCYALLWSTTCIPQSLTPPTLPLPPIPPSPSISVQYSPWWPIPWPLRWNPHCPEGCLLPVVEAPAVTLQRNNQHTCNTATQQSTHM